MHFVFYHYCCEGQCPVSNHLNCRRKVRGFDHDWRVATLMRTELHWLEVPGRAKYRHRLCIIDLVVLVT